MFGALGMSLQSGMVVSLSLCVRAVDQRMKLQIYFSSFCDGQILLTYLVGMYTSGVAYPGVRDNRSTLNTKTGYDDDDDRLFYK